MICCCLINFYGIITQYNNKFKMHNILDDTTKFSPAHYDGTVSSSSVRAQTNENRIRNLI